MPTKKKEEMQVSPKGLELIKRFEGFKDSAYKCPGGVWTIGYGSTKWEDDRAVQILDKLEEPAQERAHKLLKHSIKEYENAINKLVSVALNQNQFDALVSLVYNIGIQAFRQSTLLSLLNKGSPIETVAHQFDRWVFAGSTILEGLKNRRAVEKELFLKK